MIITLADIIQIIIAFIAVGALIVSICSIFITNKQNKYDKVFLNKTKYFDNIFLKYLIDDIPQTRMYLRFENNKLTDEEKFLKALNDMKKKALYYKIAELYFYNRLKHEIEDLEDFIAESKNKNIIQEEQGLFWTEFNSKLETIYKCIDEYVFE